VGKLKVKSKNLKYEFVKFRPLYKQWFTINEK